MTRTESMPIFDRVICWSLDHPLPPLVRYLSATLLVCAVALLRAALVTELLPWLLFIPAIIVIGLVLGEWTAIYASLLSSLLAAISIHEGSSPHVLTGSQWSGSLLFVVIALGLSRLSGEVRAAFRRARALNAQLADREAFLTGVLSASTDCIKVLDLDGRLTFMSEGGMKVMEVDDFSEVESCPWPDFWQDSANEQARNAIARANAGESSHFVGKANTFRGTPKWWDVSVSSIPGYAGSPARILSVSRDNTELMASQEQQRLLNGELGHRLKNVLSLVQSIANQTFRQATSLEDANQALAARLVALGKATDVLTSTAWQSATLRDVVDAGLVSVDGMRDRVLISGPPLRLDSQVALALTLALHELTTNACKYGALSNDTGVVSLDWQCHEGENDEDVRFSLQWRESGGPTVTPPTRTGFGSKMIERSLRSYFRGKSSLKYEPEGVIFSIDAPLPKATVAVGE